MALKTTGGGGMMEEFDRLRLRAAELAIDKPLVILCEKTYRKSLEIFAQRDLNWRKRKKWIRKQRKAVRYGK